MPKGIFIGHFYKIDCIKIVRDFCLPKTVVGIWVLASEIATLHNL